MAMRPQIPSLARFAADKPITETNHPANFKLVTKTVHEAGKDVTKRYWTIMLPGGASVGKFSTPAKAYAYMQKHPEDVTDNPTDSQIGGPQPNSSGGTQGSSGASSGGGGTQIPGIEVGNGSNGSSGSSGVSGGSVGGGGQAAGGGDGERGTTDAGGTDIPGSSGSSSGNTSEQGERTSTGTTGGQIPLDNSTALDPRSLASAKMNELFKSIMDQVSNDSNTTHFNNAANRMRERLDSASAGNAQKLISKNLSRGFANSGLTDSGLQRNALDTQNSYAQGLSGLEDSFEKNRLTGLNIAREAASGATSNSNFIDKTLYDFLNSVNLQNTQRAIASSGNKTSQTIANMNNLSAQQIAQLEAQIQSWLASLKAGTS